MTETCEAKYRWTRTELQKAMLHHRRLMLRRGILLFAQIFSVILLLFIAVILIAWLFLDSTSSPPWASLLFLSGFCIYWLAHDKLYSRLAVRGFEKRPDAGTEVKWKFTVSSIILQTELVKAQSSWKGFMKVAETDDGFLFYPVRNVFQWIPASAFESNDCVELVRRFIRENGIPLVDNRSRK
jgi:hypothetical protein